MKYNKVIIKQIPNSSSSTINLDKYNRGRLPGCVDTFSPCLFSDGKYLTGLDENGLDILIIKNEELREARKQEIKETLEYLKKVYPTKDLSPFSSFWEDFKIKISTDTDLVLNKENPIDILRYYVLLANGYVAPSLEEASDPKYNNCSYYFHVNEVAEVKNVSKKKLLDKAKSELLKISDNKELMQLVGAYLEGTKFKRTMNPNTLYLLLCDFIENKSEGDDNIDRFLTAVKLPIEELQFKVTIETAIRKKIIKYKEGVYVRGGVNLGKNPVEIMKNLRSPEFANEFIQIHEEVNQKY